MYSTREFSDMVSTFFDYIRDNFGVSLSKENEDKKGWTEP